MTEMHTTEDVVDALALAIAVVAAYSVPSVAARPMHDRLAAVIDAQPAGSTHRVVLAMVSTHLKATVRD